MGKCSNCQMGVFGSEPGGESSGVGTSNCDPLAGAFYSVKLVFFYVLHEIGQIFEGLLGSQESQFLQFQRIISKRQRFSIIAMLEPQDNAFGLLGNIGEPRGRRDSIQGAFSSDVEEDRTIAVIKIAQDVVSLFPV